MTDPEGQVTTRNYDAGNQLTSVSYSDGKTPSVTGITYDADGERIGMTDATGVWSWKWDSLHRLASVTEGGNGTIGYQYDLDSHLTSIVYPNGKTVARGYDAAGNLTSVTDWLGHTTTFSYDANSNPSEEQYPGGVTTQLGHDNADRLITMSDAGGGHTLASFSYTRDAIGQVTSASDNNGEPSTINYTYDTLNQLTTANKAPYGYDAADNPTTFGANTTQSFDTANQLTSRAEASQVSEPPSEGTTKEKEGQKAPEGSPPSGTGAGGQGTTTTGGGVEGTQVSYKPPTKNATVSATTKRGGKLTSPKLHIGGSHELLLAFISASGPRSGTQRVTKLSGGGLRWSLVARNAGAGGVAEIWQAQASHRLSGSVTARLRASGYPATLTIAAFSGSPYIAGHTTSSGHASTPAITLPDASGALIVAVGHSGGQKAAIAPLAGQQLLAKYFDMASHSAGWVQQIQASSTSARIADATPAAQWGMVAVAIASHSAQTARIARVGKLPSTVGPAVHAAPAAANTAPSASGARSATADSGSASGGSVIHQYTYNARGDRMGESAGSTTLTLSYDQANRLIGAGNAISYAYNGDGLRMSKTVNGVTTHFVWSEAESLPELLQDGATYYIYGPEGAPIEQISGSTPVYLHQDQQGSTRLLTDGEGNVVGRYNYDAWGNVTSHTGSAATNLQYDGQYTDAETGYQYLRARYYDPKTGQFLTKDPATSLTLSRYGYVHNNPLAASDPTGLWSFDLCLGGCVGYQTGQGWGTGHGLGGSVQIGHVSVGGGTSVLKYGRTGRVSISSGVPGIKGIGGELDVQGGRVVGSEICIGAFVSICGPPDWSGSGGTEPVEPKCYDNGFLPNGYIDPKTSTYDQRKLKQFNIQRPGLYPASP
jgi:RHS repeat-associated protein